MLWGSKAKLHEPIKCVFCFFFMAKIYNLTLDGLIYQIQQLARRLTDASNAACYTTLCFRLKNVFVSVGQK